LIVARIGAQVPDTKQVVPFVSRVWMFSSGVMFSITAVTKRHASWVGTVMMHNPGYVYLTLARHALLVGYPAPLSLWLYAVAWSVGTLAVGFLFFWRGEEMYGNV
jgi:teichoic acid transport system permease protein